MTKTGRCFIVIILVAAAAAGATRYLDQRFNGSFPPGGWSIVNYNGCEWYGGTGGPNGNYAHGTGAPPSYESGYAILDSPTMNIPQGTTVYYRYQYSFGIGGVMSGDARFYLLYTDNQSILASYGISSWSWAWASGSAAVTRAAPIRARWHFSAGSAGMPTFIEYCVDTCQITDEPMDAVAPASLGRVKTLFR